MSTPAARKIDTAIARLLAGLGSDASRRGYQGDWGQFTAWLQGRGINVLRVSPQDVERYMFHLSIAGKAHRTRSRALSVLREIYRAFVCEGLVRYNPAREVKNPKENETGGRR